jgi:hypothetical protein
MKRKQRQQAPNKKKKVKEKIGLKADEKAK